MIQLLSACNRMFKIEGYIPPSRIVRLKLGIQCPCVRAVRSAPSQAHDLCSDKGKATPVVEPANDIAVRLIHLQ